MPNPQQAAPAPNAQSLLASAARTATASSAGFSNDAGYTACTVVWDTTAVSGSPSLTLTIEGYAPAAGKWYTILSSAAVSTTGTRTYNVNPKLTAAANVTANQQLPAQVRATVTAGTADSCTYSVDAIFLP